MKIEPEYSKEEQYKDGGIIEQEEILLGAPVPDVCCEYINLNYDGCDEIFCGIYQLDSTKDKPTFVHILDDHLILKTFEVSNVI